MKGGWQLLVIGDASTGVRRFHLQRWHLIVAVLLVFGVGVGAGVAVMEPWAEEEANVVIASPRDFSRYGPAMMVPARFTSASPLTKSVLERAAQGFPQVIPMLEPPPLKEIQLKRLATHEALKLRPFDVSGVPEPGAFGMLKHLLRDSHSGKTHSIDPRLIRLLMRISAAFRGKPLQIISGYRPPGNGTSKGSYHTRGMAADIRVAGVTTQELRDTAIALGIRGVGLYSEGKFVHVDVRSRTYFWEGDTEDDADPDAANRSQTAQQRPGPTVEQPAEQEKEASLLNPSSEKLVAVKSVP